MAYVFYALGWVAVLIGAALMFLALQTIRGTDDPAVLLGTGMVIWPGLSIIGSGLFLLAVGGVLYRLDRLIGLQRQATKATKEAARISREREPAL